MASNSAVWTTSIDRNGATSGEYKWADRAVDEPAERPASA
jgi:hypothetical protein